MSMLKKVLYRLTQVKQQLGLTDPLSSDDHRVVESLLASAAPAAYNLFYTMSLADQQHSLRVYQGLRQRGCQDEEMLRAALLHDVGKAQGRVPFWTRPAIVLGKHCAPHLLAHLALTPSSAIFPSLPTWRRALSYAWWHAEVGADLCAAAGLSERTVLYVRTHHQKHGPAAELHLVDEVS